MLGRRARTGSVAKKGLGYTHIHTAIDAYSRLAYSEFAGVENTVNCVAFLDRAVAWFADQGITIKRILTDNGNGYRSHAWAARCSELGITHTRTKPYHPATNGKVERTRVEEWAYARLWRSEASRRSGLDRFLHRYTITAASATWLGTTTRATGTRSTRSSGGSSGRRSHRGCRRASGAATGSGATAGRPR